MLSLTIRTHATANTELNYVALGDSIALGFQPNANELKDGCYAALLKQYFEKDFVKVNLENYAITGQNSKNLLDQLYNIELAKADVITISIGSNDILKLFYSILYQSLNCKNEDDLAVQLKQLIDSVKNCNLFAIKKIYSTINGILKSQSLFDDAVDDFEKNFTKAMEIIREKNPTARIVVTNFYNPFEFIASFGFKEFEAFTHGIMDSMNAILEKMSAEYNFQTVDISFIGNDLNCLNVNIDSEFFQVDPHPNQLGHTKIYEKIIELLNKEKEKTECPKQAA